MVRKSERNKVGSEKPTTSRKPTRASRRRRKSTSESEPEPDVPEEKTAEEIPLPPQEVTEVTDVPEPPKTPARRGRPRRQPAAEENIVVVEEEPPKTNQEWNEDEGFWGESSKAEAETPKMDKENSTWKIQSSNGSGGEIQKLKICRQRLTDSAESSSSPAKEMSSPRRKRKDKDRNLELDGTESTGSHTDTDTPTSSVPPSIASEALVDNIEKDESASKRGGNEEIPLPQQEPVIQEADSASVERGQAKERVDKNEKSQDAASDVKDVEMEKKVDAKEEQAKVEEAAESKSITEETVSESVETVIIEAEADIVLADGPVEEVVIAEVPAKAHVPEKTPEAEEVKTAPDEDQVEAPGKGEVQAPVTEEVPAPETEEVSAPESVEVSAPVTEEVLAPETEGVSTPGTVGVSAPETEGVSVPETEEVSAAEMEEAPAPDTEEAPAPDTEEVPAPAPDTTQPGEGEDVEEGELKPAKKLPRNLKLAVSNEDAMQQIAKKLNERAARFSKEATEEAARRSVPHKSSKNSTIEEEEEEGEISRDPCSTKTLELKRLSDDDVEPTNKRQDRKRRPVSGISPSTPNTPSDVQKDYTLETAKQLDVSTELLLNYLPGVIERISEEEAQLILAPKENEPEVREVLSDEPDSAGEPAEVVEEEGELMEEVKEGRRRSIEDRKATKVSSRDEPKRTERRVTKESKDGTRKTSRKERRLSEDEPRAKKKYEKENKDKKSPSKHKIADRMEKPEIPKPEENHKSVRKIALVSDDTNPMRRSISPPTKKASCILFITNLVRPFTIGQLKELLNRTGTISPNGFYIDKIKSKCFVKYNDVEMAIETRHALHGVKWPVTNPRTLRVEFSTDDAMEAVKKQAEEEDNAAKKQDLVAQNIDKGWLAEKDIVKPPRKPKNLVREWDMGKDVNEIAQVNEVKKGKEDEWGVKAKDKTKEDGRRRPISPSLDKSEPAKKIKRRDTDAPAKLLDDLFRKTNATPCIYWLPLTSAQIAVKEEMRRQHMAEHQKRLAELRKSETSRRDKDKSRDRDRERERVRDRRRK